LTGGKARAVASDPVVIARIRATGGLDPDTRRREDYLDRRIASARLTR
jgi:hypothetical protein